MAKVTALNARDIAGELYEAYAARMLDEHGTQVDGWDDLGEEDQEAYTHALLVTLGSDDD